MPSVEAAAYLAAKEAEWRESVRLHPPAPGEGRNIDVTLRQEAFAIEIHELPTQPYLGLTFEEAHSRTVSEGRTLRRLPPDGRSRPDFDYRRVNIILGDSGRVVKAYHDESPWITGRDQEQASGSAV